LASQTGGSVGTSTEPTLGSGCWTSKVSASPSSSCPIASISIGIPAGPTAEAAMACGGLFVVTVTDASEDVTNPLSTENVKLSTPWKLGSGEYVVVAEQVSCALQSTLGGVSVPWPAAPSWNVRSRSFGSLAVRVTVTGVFCGVVAETPSSAVGIEAADVTCAQVEYSVEMPLFGVSRAVTFSPVVKYCGLESNVGVTMPWNSPLVSAITAWAIGRSPWVLASHVELSDK